MSIIEVVAYKCSGCNCKWIDKYMAERCCPESCECCGRDDLRQLNEGKQFFSRVCFDCDKGIDAEKYRRKLEAAQDVTGEYSGYVYAEGGDGIGKYFDNPEEAAESGIEWAFCCEPFHHSLDLDDAIESLCDNGYEGMEDFLTIPKELRVAVDQFNEMNSKAMVSWKVDYSRKMRTTA